MKKSLGLLMVVVALALATDEFLAQEFRLKAGLNLSNMITEVDGNLFSEDYKMLPGFHVGGTAAFPLADNFSLETGLLLSTKGFRISAEDASLGGTLELEQKLSLLYLDVPLNARASFDLGGTKVYGVFGPYLGLGLSGKTKTEVTLDGQTETDQEDIEWGSNETQSDLKRLDFGFTIGAGVALTSNVQIDLTYGLGLANISPYADEGVKINNRFLCLSVGYMLSGK